MTEITIQEKINFIVETLKTLKDILKKRKQYKQFEQYLLFAAEKKAEEIVESAISINQELLKNYFQHISESYYESFIDLQKTKIFSEDELKLIASTAGFRNRLAHDYLELNPDITLKSMEKILRIYPEYLKKIRKFIT